MKRLCIVFVCMIMIFALSGCNKDDYTKQIDGLNKKVEDQRTYIDELEEENERLQREILDNQNLFETLQSFRIEAVSGYKNNSDDENQDPCDYLDIAIGCRYLNVCHEMDNVNIEIFCGYEPRLKNEGFYDLSEFYLRIYIEGYEQKENGRYAANGFEQELAVIENFHFVEEYELESMQISSVNDLPYRIDIKVSPEVFVQEEGFFSIVAWTYHGADHPQYPNEKYYTYAYIWMAYKIVFGRVILSVEEVTPLGYLIW